MLDQVAQVKWRRCLGDALQLCVSTALASEAVPELPEILEKCRGIVEYFRQSRVAAEQLESAQRDLGLPQRKLKLDCPSRWNSMVAT